MVFMFIFLKLTLESYIIQRVKEEKKGYFVVMPECRCVAKCPNKKLRRCLTYVFFVKMKKSKIFFWKYEFNNLKKNLKHERVKPKDELNTRKCDYLATFVRRNQCQN